MKNNKGISEIKSADMLNSVKNATMEKLHVAQIGVIDRVNEDQTCNIKLQYKKSIPDPIPANPDNMREIELPLLTSVPYVVLGGGSAYIDMPMKDGDTCIVIFNDTNMHLWWKNGAAVVPNNKRKHSLSDAIAIVGISSAQSARKTDGDKVRLIGKSGPEGDLKAAARVEDEIKITSQDDSTFLKWVSYVNSALLNLCTTPVITVGTPTTQTAPPLLVAFAQYFASPPTSLTGKITKGSKEVEIG